MNIKLVLSGGGPKGAWQVGVLYALIKSKVITKIDQIYGVSVGSLNGFLLWMFLTLGNNSLLQAVSQLIDYWLKYGDDKYIFKKRPLHKVIYELLFKKHWNGFYSTEPLRQNLMKEYEQYKYKFYTNNIDLYCGVVDMNTGKYENVYINELYKSNKHKEIIDIVVASCSVPVVTPPVKVNINGIPKFYVDGGIRNVIPNIHNLENSQIFVLATRPSLMYMDRTKYSFVDTVSRFIEIIEDEFFADEDRMDVYKAHNSEFHVIKPSIKFDTVKLTKFSKDDVEQLIRLGIQDGMKFVDKIQTK